MQKELDFLLVAEKLKMELRHCWLSNGIRQESVAEHSWRLALMCFRYASKLDQPVNVEKCLKLAIVHDLAEAKVGDTPVFHCNSKAAKFELENSAMLELKQFLNDKNGDEIYDIWHEFEMQKTSESKFVRALDKLEAFIQHNESPLSTWEEREKRMIFQRKWLKQYCEYDSFLNALCNAVIEHAINKMVQAGENLEEIKLSALKEESLEKNEIAH
jgi:putative hydrolase of HD superfamily